MPPTWSQNSSTLGQGAVLAWAATSAVGLTLPNVVQSALVLMLQQKFNAAAPIFTSLNASVSRISEDGLWGQKTAQAALLFLAYSREPSEPAPSVLGDAFDAAHGCAGIKTSALLRQRFPALRDAVTSFGNTTHGVGQGVTLYANQLLDLVRTAPTTADVGGRAANYLGTLFPVGTNAPTATVVSTRTAPDTKTLQQATQTPTVDPNIVAASQGAASTPTEMTLPAVDVVGRPWHQRANLKVIIPSVIVGVFALVWIAKQRRGRR